MRFNADAAQSLFGIIAVCRADQSAKCRRVQRTGRQTHVAIMIRHIVLFTAKNKADIDRIVNGLSILTAIPHVRRLEIGRNRKADQFDNDIDVVVYGEFENEAELSAYKAHELYKESIERVRPLRQMRVAADYESTEVTLQV